jgi:hypothetical protein
VKTGPFLDGGSKPNSFPPGGDIVTGLTGYGSFPQTFLRNKNRKVDKNRVEPVQLVTFRDRGF